MGTGVSPPQKPNGIREDIAEIKTSLKCVESMLTSFRLEYTREHERLVSEARSALELAKANKDEIGEIRKEISPLITWAKIIGAVGSILIGLIVVLLWNLLLGNWTIIHP